MERLSSNRHPPFAVPVFLGDSLKWGKNQALWSYEGLSIPTDEDYEIFINDPGRITDAEFDDYLKFPDRVVADTEHFDQLVDDLAMKASSRGRGDPKPKLASTFAKFSIDKEDQPIIQRTFENMCDLHDDEKDHIWGYYVRNLARPTWLAQPSNRLDVLVGNPPWLAYRHMTQRQKAAFREMVKERWIRGGIKFAPTQDLSALFVARCVEQYLKPGGRFGFVMPGAVLALEHYKGFRTGVYGGKIEPVWVRFERPWDLRNVKPKFFSQHAGVVLGRRAVVGQSATPLIEAPDVWSGRFATSTATKSETEGRITRTIAELAPILVASGSPYGPRCFQGATFVPQFTFIVKADDLGTFGPGVGRMAVQSRRSANEHPPWADLDPMHETIEDKFIRHVYLGESLSHSCFMIPHWLSCHGMEVNCCADERKISMLTLACRAGGTEQKASGMSTGPMMVLALDRGSIIIGDCQSSFRAGVYGLSITRVVSFLHKRFWRTRRRSLRSSSIGVQFRLLRKHGF